MHATVFVDASVLLYARDASEGERQARAMEWMTHLWNTRSGRLSYQVLEEFYLTATGRLDPGLTPREARDEVRDLLSWRPVALDQKVLEGAWSVADLHQLTFWDATVVAAAQTCGCRLLLTDAFEHGRELGAVEVVNPFAEEPGPSYLHEKEKVKR